MNKLEELRKEILPNESPRWVSDITGGYWLYLNGFCERPVFDSSGKFLGTKCSIHGNPLETEFIPASEIKNLYNG